MLKKSENFEKRNENFDKKLKILRNKINFKIQI